MITSSTSAKVINAHTIEVVPVDDKSNAVKAIPIYEENSNPDLNQLDNLKHVKKNDKCCIIGFAPSWNEAPYDEPGIDFWGINELYIYLNQYKINAPFGAWFEIHNIKHSPSKQKKQHQEFLRNCKIPLITQQHWKEYPTSLAYPVKYVVDYFNQNFVIDEKNTGFNDYSNQISWMIALAIVLGYKEIMVYGVDMAQESEYAFQRASCQFFLGYAIGHGIKVRIPKSCELLKAGKLYGFESDNAPRFRKKNRIKTCNESIQQIKIRNAEIDFFRDKIDNDMDEKIQAIDLDLNSINEGIDQNKFIYAVASEVIRFAKDMPKTLEEINSKKVDIIKQNTLSLDRIDADLKTLKTKKEELMKKRERAQIDNHINHKLLDEEYSANLASINKLSGAVQECNHDLNNNLV